jgi:hypothetical protein
MDSEEQQRCDAPTARIIAVRTSPECEAFIALLAQLTHAEATRVWEAAHAAAQRMLNGKTEDHMPQIANDDDNGADRSENGAVVMMAMITTITKRKWTAMGKATRSDSHAARR